MKNLLILIVALFLTGCKTLEPEVIHSVRLNSLGYLPETQKQASITEPSEIFVIRNAVTGRKVVKGKVSPPLFQEDVDQQVWTADFSQITKPGNYYLEIPGKGRSVTFPVGTNIYQEAYITAARAFYLWRCGTEVSAEHQGLHYHQGICHTHDGCEDYIGRPGNLRDGTGGWHDAGDYGKYTVNAGITLGILLMAWEHFQPAMENTMLKLPETAPGYPEFLKELKWETDWLLKMQYPDGSGRVSHKLTRLNFEGFIMAEQDDGKRFFTEWSSAATASFVAVMARSARVFQPYDTVYARKCLDAAGLSYDFLRNNPEEKPFVQGDFKTGGYQSPDDDDRLWAAAEMWETTGDPDFLADFEKQAVNIRYRVDENWDWGNVTNLGMFTYVMSSRSGKHPETDQNIRQNIIRIANQIVAQANKDVYRRPLAGRYYWGCNGTIARQTVNLFVAHRLSPNTDYRSVALDAIGHLFGRNYYNRSYVTGVGLNPPKYPHDRRSGADGNDAPWPGYLVGGGHKATDWIDEQASYSHNEIAINWQAPLVFALAWFLNP